MQKRLLSVVVLIAYSALLVQWMVFRDLPVIRIGRMMFKFGGVDANGDANFIPFKTILPYLFGYKGLVIAGVNIVGNIVLLVPVGFLLGCACRNMGWRKSLVIAVAVGFLIEGMQVLFRTGIFDIDDVILNGLGVVIGYWIFRIFFSKKRAG